MLTIVTIAGSTPRPAAMELATLLMKVVSAASDSAVTFSGKLPKSKVRAAFTVYVVTFLISATTTGGAGGAAVVVMSGSHVG